MALIKEKINISLVQFAPEWENISANLSKLDNLLEGILTDVIILPEMFNTGFIDDPTSLAETEDGPTLRWMIEKAKESKSLVMGSFSFKEESKYYNRMYCCFPDGSTQYYDKRYLFGLGGEAQYFSRGTSPLVFEYLGWKIQAFICYDLRFPVWNRNTDNYDLAVYVASWPSVRSNAWRQLLIARSIENQAYVAAVNRVGMDGKGHIYNGLSGIIDYEGMHLIEVRDQEIVVQKDIEKSKLETFRKKLPFLNDRDDFQWKD